MKPRNQQVCRVRHAWLSLLPEWKLQRYDPTCMKPWCTSLVYMHKSAMRPSPCSSALWTHSLRNLPRKHYVVSGRWNGSEWAACFGCVILMYLQNWCSWLSTRTFKATLEIEFLHQTLGRYVTTSATKTLSELYTTISQAYARRPGDENLQSHLDGVKKTLAETRRATGIEFLCFRQMKTSSTKPPASARPKDREKGATRSGKESKWHAHDSYILDMPSTRYPTFIVIICSAHCSVQMKISERQQKLVWRAYCELSEGP